MSTDHGPVPARVEGRIKRRGKMKYFNHMCDANSKQWIQSVREELGHLGVDVYWTVLEIVGYEIDYNLNTVHKFKLDWLAKKCGTSLGALMKCLQFFSDQERLPLKWFQTNLKPCLNYRAVQGRFGSNRRRKPRGTQPRVVELDGRKLLENAPDFVRNARKWLAKKRLEEDMDGGKDLSDTVVDTGSTRSQHRSDSDKSGHILSGHIRGGTPEFLTREWVKHTPEERGQWRDVLRRMGWLMRKYNVPFDEIMDVIEDPDCRPKNRFKLVDYFKPDNKPEKDVEPEQGYRVHTVLWESCDPFGNPIYPYHKHKIRGLHHPGVCMWDGECEIGRPLEEVKREYEELERRRDENRKNKSK